MASKRPRDIDSDMCHYDRNLKRRRVVPATTRPSLIRKRDSKADNLSDNFTPCAINSDDIRARVKYHVKRCNRINNSHHDRRQSIETPAISVNELEKMCERAMKERENEVRLEYEKALSYRLLEMYESFLKFNTDMMSTGPLVSSYVS